MTVYKGIGKHSSSQSPAMNLNRSAVSLRLLTQVILTKLKGRRTSTNNTCDIRGGAIFGQQRHNLNKPGRGSQGTNYKHNIKALGLLVSEKKIF